MSMDCLDLRRRDDAVAAGLNGIDFIEIASADQRTLEVHTLSALPGETGGPPGPALSADQVVVSGGVRVLDVEVVSVASSGRVLTVVVDRAGDFSPYELRLVAAPGVLTPPAGFDPALSYRTFDFKAGCPTIFDCAPAEGGNPPRPPSPVIDYLARDYTGFVRLMRDRLTLTNPEWRDQSPADPLIAVVELLADLGDRLSYEQDAAATEAYLRTARSRVSLRRHARLLDHTVDDGANASTWVHVEVRAGGALDGAVIPAESVILTGRGGPSAVAPDAVEQELAAGAVAFQTRSSLVALAAHNEIEIHRWSDSECTLRQGATSTTVVAAPGMALEIGTPVVLEQHRDPETGDEADADPTLRHLVRLTAARPEHDPVTGTDVVEIEWSVDEALPFDLVVSSRPDPSASPVSTATVRANLVEADHGLRLGPDVLGSLVVPEFTDRHWRPRLDLADLALIDDGTGRLLPDIRLNDRSGLTEWYPLPDLLGSRADEPAFVVEFEYGHRPILRFGDGRFGRRPTPGTTLDITARLGTGPGGNVGADAVSRLVTSAHPDDVEAVRNPLPAIGGRSPQSREQILTEAPVTPLRQERAVTLDDWVEVAERHPQVQRAHATLRWTGSWWTVFIAIDRLAGGSVQTDGLADELADYLDKFRMTGLDIRVVDPMFVALDLELKISADAGYYRNDVMLAVRRALSPGPHPDGSTGLFHPNRLSFGGNLPLSAIHAAIDHIAGVRCADIVRCHRLGQLPAGELVQQIVRVGEGEVLRLDDDPNFPEHGRLQVRATGGV